ncbi:hypothetical protein [Leifsonia sp. Le1]|uniref:hypothetical protein n=1 Tax=Leifsonia sp. Le1 TaxID=3404918 RepID=UPI003EBC6E5C
MTDASPTVAFDLLTTRLLDDPDDDVVVTEKGLNVHGKLFAFLDGDALVVDLPAARALDLVDRGIASPASGGVVDARGSWVAIGDVEDWQELASEAHQFVGEPPVGRDS